MMQGTTNTIWLWWLWCWIPTIGCAIPTIIPQNGQFFFDGQKYTILSVPGKDYFKHPSFFLTQDQRNGLWWQDGTVSIISLLKGQKWMTFAAPYPAVALSPDMSYAILQPPGGYISLNLSSKEQKVIPNISDSHTVIDWVFTTSTKAVSRRIYHTGLLVLDATSGTMQEIRPRGLTTQAAFDGLISSDGKDMVFLVESYSSKGVVFEWVLLDLTTYEIVVQQQSKQNYLHLLCSASEPEYFYAGNEEICLFRRGDWSICKKSPKFDRIVSASLDPEGKFLYAVSAFSGLYILDTETLQVKSHYDVGKTVNAYSMGILFGQTYAWITTPYQGLCSVLNWHDHTLRADITIEPACGAFFMQDGSMVVLPVELPYE